MDIDWTKKEIAKGNEGDITANVFFEPTKGDNLGFILGNDFTYVADSRIYMSYATDLT